MAHYPKMETPAAADQVLDFWFGELDAQGRADEEHARRWFSKDPRFDREVRERFEPELRAILAGERQSWFGSARGRLAALIVLDQLSRNMYRDTPRMFVGDTMALSLCTEGFDAGLHRGLALDERTFFTMPLMHSESLGDQEACVARFTELRDEQPTPELRARVELNLDYAIRHRNIVARFGRFPHRNAILGRESTPEELEFLTKPGSAF